MTVPLTQVFSKGSSVLYSIKNEHFVRYSLFVVTNNSLMDTARAAVRPRCVPEFVVFRVFRDTNVTPETQSLQLIVQVSECTRSRFLLGSEILRKVS